jgi:hypothetical protein
MDVITAFLNGELNDKIYMKTPLGYDGYGDSDYVVKINRALYGLR